MCIHLCLLSITLFSQMMKAADVVESVMTKKAPIIQEITLEPERVPGLINIVKRWHKNNVLSHWIKHDDKYTKVSNRKVAGVCIWASSKEHDEMPFYERPYALYRLTKVRTYNGHTLYFPAYLLNNSAVMISPEGVTEIKQLGLPKQSSSVKLSNLEYNTPEPRELFDEDLKMGRTSQLLYYLQAYEQSIPSKTAKVSLGNIIQKELFKDIQRNIAAHALRNRHLLAKKTDIISLQQKISAFNPTMDADFVSIVNCLIDDTKIHHGLHMSDGHAIKLLFEKNEDRLKFNLTYNTIKTTNKDGSKHIFNFTKFVNFYGKLPVEVCAEYARNIYKSWYTSWGEPPLVIELRAINTELQDLEPTDPGLSKRRSLLQARADTARAALNHLMTDIIVAITEKDLPSYCAIKNDKKRLAWTQEAVAQEESDVLADEYKIAEQLYALTAKERTEGISITETIEYAVGSSQKNNTEVMLLKQRLMQHIDTLIHDATSA